MPAIQVPYDTHNLPAGELFLSAQEQEIIQQRMKTLDELTKDPKIRGKYKIEILFGRERSSAKPSVGALSFWESGAKFHGGGDCKVYVCPQRRLNRGHCEAIIPDYANTGAGYLICPACGSRWKDEEVIGEVMGRHTDQDWAKLILKYFLLMDMHADIRIKHPPTDIRSVALVEQEKNKGGELLGKARSSRTRATSIYPLYNIIRDTSHGASLYGRILAFLRA